MLGGPSAEREVSLRSGKSVAKALRSLGHVVEELDPKEPDVEFVAGDAGGFSRVAWNLRRGRDGAAPAG